jgi:hypothetical protein
MAAPLGFKTFNTGDVLSAADTNGYLMQGIWVFANATARDAAVTSPQEGNSCYLKDTDVIQVYSGSSWVVKSGGSSPLTTKGDLYTYSTTDARLPVGANGTTLVADSSTATGLKWETPASGGMTLLSTTTLSGASTTISTINQGYKNLQVLILSYTTTSNAYLTVAPNSASNVDGTRIEVVSTAVQGDSYDNGEMKFNYNTAFLSTGTKKTSLFIIYDYASTTQIKPFSGTYAYQKGNDSTMVGGVIGGFIDTTSAISSLEIKTSGGTFNGGTVLIYGVS